MPAAGRLDDLGAAAVVEGDADGQALVGLCQLAGLADAALQVGRQGIQAADVQQADALLVQGGQLAVDDAADEAQQRVHLAARPPPVLGRKGEERQVLDTALAERLDDAADVLRAGAVARLARETALLRPAAVAVHDQGDVARHAAATLGLRPAGPLLWLAAGGVDYHGTNRLDFRELGFFVP